MRKYTTHCDYCKKEIEETELNGFCVTVTDQTGMYAVQGGFGGEFCRYNIQTIEDCLVMCIKNILI